MRPAMRLALAILLIGAGLLWTLQGLGFVQGSVMSGVTVWAVVGPLVAVGGIWLIVRSRRRT